MKRALIIAAMVFLALPMVAQGIIVQETCINDTHLNVYYDFDFTADGEDERYAFNQTHKCTHNCTNDKCNGMNFDVDSRGMWITFLLGISLLGLGVGLGIPYGKLVGKEDIRAGWDTTTVVRYLFFFVGFYLSYTSLAMGRRINSMYGGDANILSAMNGNIMIMTFTLVVFLFIFAAEFVFNVIKYMMDSAEEKKWGYTK